MNLQLTRPIVFFDIESTGLDKQVDRIVELSMCKVHPDGTREVKTHRYNPEIQIPEAVSLIHGITNEMVKDCPLFSQHAKGIMEFIKDCDLAGFNSNAYDVPMLYNELLRCGHVIDYKSIHLIDVGNIFKIMEPRTLGASVKFYLGREHTEAHSAEADILATVDVFQAQLERYPDLPKDMNDLQLFCNHGNKILDLSGKFTTNKEGEVVFNFGKYRGEVAKDHPDFLEWMLYKANFAPDTNEVCRELLGVDEDSELCDNEEHF